MVWWKTSKKKKEPEHTGVMVAFYLPDSVAEDLKLSKDELPEGVKPESADELHITLVYGGDYRDLEPKKDKFFAAVKEFAQKSDVIEGSLNGMGCFGGSEEDGTKPLYANFDSPQLPEFRQRLMESLEEAGVEIKSNHGFTPHITLAYIPIDSEVPTIDVPMVKVVFDRIVIAWGGEHTGFDLGKG